MRHQNRFNVNVRTIVLALLGVVALPACTDPACAETGTCAGPPVASAPDASVDAGRVYPEVPPPPGCDPTLDVGDSPGCVVDGYALFVDATNGNNANSGTKASPFRTIDTATNIDALAGRPRIYLCGTAPYVESVRLPANVSLYGGLSCGTWSYTGAITPIVPSAPGHVLHVDASVKGVVFADLELIAKDGEADSGADGGSSVAVFVNASKATFRRVAIIAGKGAPGLPRSAPSNHVADRTGASTTTTNGGSAKTCACKVFGSSTGGKGGNGTGPGEKGSLDPFVDGLGGTAGVGGTVCSAGGTGASAIAGGAGGRKSLIGSLVADAWVPGHGRDGGNGTPGAGGGGGGGNKSRGGGGGACGGCGGSGGAGGRGGGASIAMALLASDVTLFGCTLQSGQAGNGATGGRGEDGAPGGSGGAGACNGGAGGYGAGGGGGAGGAGGLSAAVVWTGGSFVSDPSSSLTAGFGGIPGAGGPAGNGIPIGAEGEDGIERLTGPAEVALP